MRQSELTKKVCLYAVLTAVAIIFSYVEMMIPINFTIPGMKLGLTNIVVVFALYLFTWREAFAISIMRIFVSTLLFGNLNSIMYSLAGGILSLIIMIVLKKTRKFSVVGVSMAGGVFHNLGQIMMAVLIVENLYVAYYFPFLMITGVVTGMLIGIIAGEVNKRITKKSYTE